MRYLLVILMSLSLWAAEASPEEWTLLFMGDTGLATTYPETQRTLRKLGQHADPGAWGFAKLGPFLKEQDAVVINLETTLSEGLTSPLKGRKDYLHADPPLSTTLLLKAHGVRAATLANNHAGDFGDAGLRATRHALAIGDIQSFGAGETQEEARKPWIYQPEGGRPVAIFAVFEARESYAQKYDWYARTDHGGVTGFNPTFLEQQIRELRALHPDAWVVLFPHWGTNYRYRRDRQVEMAHAAIDAGVDLIIGHGSHILQEIEHYRGKWIIYSLGNGIFLTPGRFELAGVISYSALAQLRLEEDGPVSLRLYPILADNRLTGYQPRFLTKQEAVACWQNLLNHSAIQAEHAPLLSVQPHYLQIALQTPALP